MLIPAKNRRIVQNAFVVNDLDAAMRKWTQTLGIGPFMEFPIASPDLYLYRGKNIRPDIRVGLAQAGEVQIEFMQIMTETPSVYRDVFAPGQEGFHHACIFTDDMDQDLARHASQGLDIVVTGNVGDMRFAFVDARPTLGFMLEIITDSPLIQAIYGSVRRASENWDGSDPIRPFSM